MNNVILSGVDHEGQIFSSIMRRMAAAWVPGLAVQEYLARIAT